jgi:hypothetical protein
LKRSLVKAWIWRGFTSRSKDNEGKHQSRKHNNEILTNLNSNKNEKRQTRSNPLR